MYYFVYKVRLFHNNISNFHAPDSVLAFCVWVPICDLSANDPERARSSFHPTVPLKALLALCSPTPAKHLPLPTMNNLAAATTDTMATPSSQVRCTKNFFFFLAFLNQPLPAFSYCLSSYSKPHHAVAEGAWAMAINLTFVLTPLPPLHGCRITQ
jgi:hypothetical protein